MTANAMKEEQQRCLGAGMDDYISKPFKLQKLTQVLQKWMDQQNQAARKSA